MQPIGKSGSTDVHWRPLSLWTRTDSNSFVGASYVDDQITDLMRLLIW